MERSVALSKRGDGRTRYIVKLTPSYDCLETPSPQVAFLMELASNISVLRCGVGYFDEIVIKRDGLSWVAEMVAVQQEASS